MKQKIFSTELAYLLGLALVALSAALMAATDFGVSMVVAPAYLLHLKLSQTWAFFSFGMAEYCFQALLLLLMCLVLRRFRPYYLFSFVTAVLYGFMLDGAVFLVGYLPLTTLAARIITFASAVLICAWGVALIFHSYIAPEVYELFVKELSAKFARPISRVKIAYDWSSCLLGILLSFLFFGLWQFRGVNVGTIVSALFNGYLIGCFSRLFEKWWSFRDRLPLRKYFS